jgi:hypothetical protein
VFCVSESTRELSSLKLKLSGFEITFPLAMTVLYGDIPSIAASFEICGTGAWIQASHGLCRLSCVETVHILEFLKGEHVDCTLSLAMACILNSSAACPTPVVFSATQNCIKELKPSAEQWRSTSLELTDSRVETANPTVARVLGRA